MVGLRVVGVGWWSANLFSPKTSHQVLKLFSHGSLVQDWAKTQPTTNLRPTLLNKTKAVVVRVRVNPLGVDCLCIRKWQAPKVVFSKKGP